MFSGTATITGQQDYESFSSDLTLDPEDINNNEHHYKLSAICPEHLNIEVKHKFHL